MARRSVFVSKNSYPFFEEISVDFDWFQGFALSQKRKSQIGIHENFLNAYPDEKVLEISSASLYSLGAELSAMNLSKRTSAGITTVESAFQSSRIYGSGEDEVGPFPEYLFYPGRECKKIVKELSKGKISYRYMFDGLEFHAPSHFISLFYNYLYLNALCEDENRAVADSLIEHGYTAFTDLATKSLNCQARAAAIFVSLVRNNLIDEVKNYDSYLRLFRTRIDGKPTDESAFENVQTLDNTGNVKMLSPAVKQTFFRADAARYYEKYCACLTNKKDPDNYLDVQLAKNK